MSLRNWVKLLGLVLLTWVFFNLVVEASVVGVTLPDTFLVAN